MGNINYLEAVLTLILVHNRVLKLDLNAFASLKKSSKIRQVN